ncbi:hypothetical protein [Azospirillum sp.]|uniref:hypothetical protein n=1 Tax=Azospirillum sp. TaxID=34012 RepID=UPI002D3AE4C2|nr:hypothetical protein [Azospirillum sp.]HYF88992.1 hypothetical protein [Azospirillum sp.]
MKRLIDTIRQGIAEWLLFSAGMIAPNTEEGFIVLDAAWEAFSELAIRETAQ